MFRKLRSYFIAGLVVILPVILTFMILQFLIIKTNNLVLEPLTNILVQTAKPYLPDVYFPFAIYIVKFIIFIVLVSVVIAIGLATKLFIIRKLFSAIERFFLKVPMINKIYLSIKELSNAFLGQGRIMFEKVALVEYPRKGVYSIGFITSNAREEVQHKTKKDMMNVFIPTTPNPTSGVFLLVPSSELIYLDMSVEEALKLVVSGGKFTPSYVDPRKIERGKIT